MAHAEADLTVSHGSDPEVEHEIGVYRRCRGRPRLTDSDRARRRHESRKKYDIRRVYLGEAHKLWSELRRRTSLSDAGLAEYLILGRPCTSCLYFCFLDSRGCVSSLQSLVHWYQEHCEACLLEPELRSLEFQPDSPTAALWQCDSGHSFTQYLYTPQSAEASDCEQDEVGHTEAEPLSTAGTSVSKVKRSGSPSAFHSEDDCQDLRVAEDRELQIHRNVPEGYRCVSLVNKLIIITGPSYEALASEGIQLNMTNGANMEEVTCTVIGNVSYNQICPLDTKPRILQDHSATGEESKEQSNLLSSRESVKFLRRSRRGPVIEADGMLKMFHCPYEGCSQVYVAISSFQNHVNLVHRKGRTKVCPHPGCGKKFYLSNHLHRHMIIHSGVRDFTCETCGKSFKRKNHLEVHRRTHTGETPLQCEICGYQCRQRASLNWHMKKHTSEAQYNFTCDFCHKRFERLESVKFHKLKSHPDKLLT
uniref:Zinc finger protein 653 n=1 Tax=Periophthalmus magnuspinnatus TaxID=409849 RepID=A0A3B3ZT07_9GOBI